MELFENRVPQNPLVLNFTAKNDHTWGQQLGYTRQTRNGGMCVTNPISEVNFVSKDAVGRILANGDLSNFE